MCGLWASLAPAHDTFTSWYAPAGYVQDLELRINHDCGDSPVKEVHVMIPDGVIRVSVENRRDWKVETTTRKLDKPVPREGGRMVTEVVDRFPWELPEASKVEGAAEQ